MQLQAQWFPGLNASTPRNISITSNLGNNGRYRNFAEEYAF